MVETLMDVRNIGAGAAEIASPIAAIIWSVFALLAAWNLPALVDRRPGPPP